MNTTGTKKRNITKEDILLKARLGAARVEVKGPLLWKPTASVLNPRIVLDGCDMVAHIGMQSNPLSPLELVIEGNDVTISEKGEVLATAKLEPRAPWRDKLLRNGMTVDSFIMCTDDVQCNIIISRGCHTAAVGKACRFCSFGPQFESTMPLGSQKETLEAAEPAIEATIIAIQSGWRGFLNLAGGATPPDRRGKWTTDMVEAVMARFHESIDADVIAELQVAVQVYPPDDLGELDKWKSFGVNSVEFDNQVMDPTYFKAVCPGRGEQKKWFEAQEAGAEIFGRGRGSVANVVAGIEPMTGLLEGIEERISKGVWTMPLVFFSAPGAAMEGMQSASPDWYAELWEKMADIYLRYADTTDVDMTKDDRWGYTRTAQSTFFSPFKNIWISRLQEMGKLPPGLPNQYGVDVA